jgi:hypothetical protein
MKLAGVLIAVFGWLFAMSGLLITASNGGRLTFCILGIAVSLFGVLSVLNKAHQKEAVWKR